MLFYSGKLLPICRLRFLRKPHLEKRPYRSQSLFRTTWRILLPRQRMLRRDRVPRL